MSKPDFNLLVTLDVLLAEGSVARAARRLRLSASAMSRALARLRDATGDPLLVRAGRALVPTPRAIELREEVRQLVQGSEAVLRPAAKLDLPKLSRTFTLRTSDGFVENFGPDLIARVTRQAPGVRLRFVQKSDKDSALLREGLIDLETGVISPSTSPELRTLALFRDRFVGVARPRHPLVQRTITPERYASAQHIAVSRRGLDRGPIDDALSSRRLTRAIAVTVGTWSAALALPRNTNLIATVPERLTAKLRVGLDTFSLPFELRDVPISLLWHPRRDADSAHRWLRDQIRAVCATP